MYCPTVEMIADFFTKPLQGAQFYKFRDAILGIKAEDEESYKQEYLKILEQYSLLEKKNDEIT
jgi:heme oxygenase